MSDLAVCITTGMICLTIIIVYALSIVKSGNDSDGKTKDEYRGRQGGARIINAQPPRPPKGGSDIHDKYNDM